METSTQSNSPEFNQKMYQLGLALKEYQEFFWWGILLFFLIIPPIILLVKYVKYLIALNNVTTAHPNEKLKNASLFLWISFAINLGGSALGFANYGLVFLNIASIVLTFLAYTYLVEWVDIISRERNSQSFYTCKDGFNEMKIASVLMIVIVGLFLLPGAMKKTHGAILAEFGPSTPIQQPSQPQSPPPQQDEKEEHPQTIFAGLVVVKLPSLMRIYALIVVNH
jgi:hypothetical protein